MADINPAIERGCDKCGHVLRHRTEFCSMCGHSLAGTPHVSISGPVAASNNRFEVHWREIKQVALLFGLLLGSSLALGIAEHFNKSPWPETLISVVDALIVFAFVVIHRQHVLPLLRWPRLDARSTLETLIVATAMIVAMGSYFALLHRLGVPTLSASDEFRKAGWSVWAMFTVICLMPAVFEELAFRGVIQSTLDGIFERRDAWIIQAALFSVLHLSPIIFVDHFIMGLCFGYLRLRCKSLYPGMLLHGSWNALVLCQELYWS